MSFKFFARPSVLLLALMFIVTLALPVAAQDWTPYTGVGPSSHVVSPELRSMPLAPGNVSQVTNVPLSHRPSFVPAGSGGPDTARQITAGAALSTTAGSGFDGVLFNGPYPPDPNLSVSPKQIVQTTNVELAVYDKTGALLKGPVAIDSLFSGLPNLCATNNGGDPIVLWDKIANRWLISQLAYNSNYTTNYICVAVSQTDDATGFFNLYSIPFSHLPDYPKFGVWKSTDGSGSSDYFFSANLFSTSLFYGPVVCAFNGSDMQNNRALRYACAQGTPSHFSLLPSDYDGNPSQAPVQANNFVELSTAGTATTGQSLYMFPFTVTWGTGNTGGTLNNPSAVTISVPAYTVACGGGTCIPQPGTTKQLDSLGDRLMYRLAYRKFGAYESLVVNHSVDPGTGTAGIRWYELRNSGGGWSAYQAATFAPDNTNYRWLASIAQDKNGNIGVGYSISNSTSLYPSIYYTGRASTDPLNTLSTSENTIIAGSGAETGASRWGDYSSLSLDPGDDCTFWYTNEYFLPNSSGGVGWRTRIDWFQLPGCGIGTAATTTTVSSNNNPSAYGQNVTFTAAVSPSAATGTVQFFDASGPLGTATLSGGSASISTSALSVGPHSLTAKYSGDSTYAASTSAAFAQTVNQAATTTTVASSLNPSAYSQNVKFTATMSSSSATGTVQFFDGTTSIGTATLSGGSASFSTSTLSAGPHSITATYSGDSNFTGSTSAAITQTVNPAGTTTALASSANPSAYGQTVTFTATVSPSSATGTVQFFDGSTSIGSATLSGRSASFSTSTLSAGPHSITATYSGDSNFTGSTSAALTQTVNQAATTTTVTSSVNPSGYGQSVTFTATVSLSSATGTVQFFDGSTSIGTATLTGGSASISTSALLVGSHSITATYGGDSNFSGSTSAALTQTVNPLATTTTIASSLNPSTYGQSVTFTASVSPAAATGAVQFFEGGTQLGQGTLSGGSASFSTSSLSAGPHSITAKYSGDSTYGASTSAAVAQTVNQGATTTTAGSSPNPSTYNQSVTFTATVSPSSATGTVQFFEGGTQLGQGTLSGGSASFSTSSLSAGPHSITATYGGDSNFTGSTSAAITQTVNPAGTTTALASSVNPSAYGQNVTFTATVSPASATGTVQFFEGGTQLGQGTLSGGSASFSTSSLSAGPHSITATYGGDSNFTGSTSGTITQTVNPPPTTTTITSSQSPSTVGQSVTFTASESPASATGTVQFFDNGTAFGSATLSGGSASVSTSSLSTGSHSITAKYSGDANFSGSTSAALTQVVNQVTTTTTVSSSQNPSAYGQNVTFTAAVSPSGATGTVQFFDSGTSLGTATLSGGSASISTSVLWAGSHSITAKYSGDSNDAASTSAVFAQTVNQAGTTTAVVSSLNPSASGQNVTFTASVSPSSATGTVQFFDGGTPLGTGTLSGGSASFSTSALSTGSHSITATYGGDSNFSGSTSPALIQTVNGSPAFTLAASPSFLMAPQGSTPTSTITVTPSGGFNAPVTLSVSGVPPQSMATFSPNPVPGSGSSTLTINLGRNTPRKTYTLTVTGSGGGLSNSTSVTLTVQ